MYVRRSRKRPGDDTVRASQDNKGSFKPFKLARHVQLKPVDLAIWDSASDGVSGNFKSVIHDKVVSQWQLQQQKQQQQQEQQQEQPLTGYAYKVPQLADCTPPVPESLPVAPPDIMETDDPIPDQDPPTGYPTPANSGDINDIYAAPYDSIAKASQHGIGQEMSHTSGYNHSIFFGGYGLWLGAAGVAPTSAVLDHRPGSLAVALTFCQQYQQQQPAWQLPEQLQRDQAANSADGGTSTSDEGWNSVHSYSFDNGSPVPSQDPPTGYPTPCASSADGTADSTPHLAGRQQLKGHSKTDEVIGGRFLGVRFQQRCDDVPQATADLDIDSRRQQHQCSCYNTPVPSQDPPSQHSGAGNDGCSFAGNCSMGHDVTAPPSPAHSYSGPLDGIPDQAGVSGGYGFDRDADAAPSSPVPSQDAPSEYPEPESPASSATESQAECSEDLSDMSSEPPPPGIDTTESHAAGLTAGLLSTEVSHASFHQPAGLHLPKNDGAMGNAVYHRNYRQAWWDSLEEQAPFDCVWDDCESGDSSVGSPRRF